MDPVGFAGRGTAHVLAALSLPGAVLQVAYRDWRGVPYAGPMAYRPCVLDQPIVPSFPGVAPHSAKHARRAAQASSVSQKACSASALGR